MASDRASTRSLDESVHDGSSSTWNPQTATLEHANTSVGGAARRALSSAFWQLATVASRPLHRGTFVLDGREFPYAVHPYNATWRNERIVEVALGEDALQRHRGERILEVGNVMAQYGHVGHDVVDRYERAPNVRDIDILDFEPEHRYDLILTISTLEHVGFDEHVDEPDKPIRAVAHLTKLLRPGGELLVTVPLGYNQRLDDVIRANEVGFEHTAYLTRVSRRNRWEQVGVRDVRKARYGLPYQNANFLAVGTSVAPTR